MLQHSYKVKEMRKEKDPLKLNLGLPKNASPDLPYKSHLPLRGRGEGARKQRCLSAEVSAGPSPTVAVTASSPV